MINIIKTNLLTQHTEAIVNPVNCVGVMGKGLALAFKTAYPENYHLYKEACNRNEVIPGKMFVYNTGSTPKYIINFPTKRHWKDNSYLKDIKNGLIDLVVVIDQYKIQSITIPALGCGLGGLDWKIVFPLIKDALKDLAVEINVIEPF